MARYLAEEHAGEAYVLAIPKKLARKVSEHLDKEGDMGRGLNEFILQAIREKCIAEGVSSNYQVTLKGDECGIRVDSAD